jgi:hypothetical protein
VRNYILCAGDWINVRIKISKWLDKQQLTLLESGLDCWCFMMRKEKSRGTCWLSYLSNLTSQWKKLPPLLYQWQQCQLESLRPSSIQQQRLTTTLLPFLRLGYNSLVHFVGRGRQRAGIAGHGRCCLSELVPVPYRTVTH